MTYKDNQPTFNVGNRKVVNFKDYLQNKDAEKAKLTKADLQSKPNSEDQQHLGNTRTEYNPVTHKLTDYSVDEIEDTLDSMEELEEGINNDSMYAISDSFNKVKNEMNLLESRLKNARSEELQEYLNKFMNLRVGFDTLYKNFEDFDNKHFGR